MPKNRDLVSLLVILLCTVVLCAGCAKEGDDGKKGKNGLDGTDGADGADGAPGTPGSDANVIDAVTAPDEFLEGLEVESEITGVTIASPPKVTFTVTTAEGLPIRGIGHFKEQDSRYVRFTITKLVPGVGGAPDRWVAYVRDDGEPDYDTGSLVDNGDGSYEFTFSTDVANVAGVPYEPTLTHRIAGQIGSRSVPIQAQNLVHDFVPAGGPVTHTRNIAVMDSCNECHADLVFHGRRFEVEYCVQCHNPDLASGEGDMAFMIHRIHASGTFEVLDDAIDYSEVTYPQDVANCRKCHDGDDAATPDGDNWKAVPSIASCDGCHNVFATGTHKLGAQPDTACASCHPAALIEYNHTTPNATPNNPDVFDKQRSITYEMVEATVDGANQVTVKFKILSDGLPIDLTNLPKDLLTPNRYPGLLLAWAEPQGGIMKPIDFNNLGMEGGQPISLDLDGFSPLDTDEPVGTLSYAAGVHTAVITDGDSQFPLGAMLRTVGLQGYLRQDLDDDGKYDESLHTPSAVVTVTGDGARRRVVDNANCAKCHEWFEGHGGNRVYEIAICTMCHVPNLSSSGRAIDPTDNDLEAELGDDPLTYPEDAQNLKDMIHGIHASAFRTTAYTHVRGGRQGFYDWSHVTFPRGAETSNCRLCHLPGTYGLPLSLSALPTTVRTTGEFDGMDDSTDDVGTAIKNVPNLTDWINSPTASSCYYCHDSSAARSHMIQNGGLVSAADGTVVTNRDSLVQMESCAVCHGSGKTADVEVVHDR
jgi:OmcA/MtrC family decaheme c-type cytochrome